MSLRQLAIGAGSIFSVYLASNVFLERIYMIKYQSYVHPGQYHQFNYPSLLVGIESLICGIFGLLRGKITKQRPNPLPHSLSFLLGFLYTVHILAANFALLFIAYPIQVIGMNCRYIMVVIVGVYFSRVMGTKHKLKPKKIIIALLATIGAISFTFFKEEGHHESEKHLDPSKYWIGYFLVFCAVFGDAFFLDNQAYAKHSFKPSANHLLTSANLYTAFFCLLVAGIQGTLVEEITFCIQHPSVNIDIMILSFLQAAGQVAVYYVITNFKQHIFPLIAMTRKIMTIILSIVIFKHRINIMQIGCLTLVFGALAYEVLDQFVFDVHPKKKQALTDGQQKNKQKIKENKNKKQQAIPVETKKQK